MGLKNQSLWQKLSFSVFFILLRISKLEKLRCHKFQEVMFIKELSLCLKLKFSYPYIFATWWCKPLIFQTYNIWSNIIQSLKYLRSTIFGCKDIGIRIRLCGKDSIPLKKLRFYVYNNFSKIANKLSLKCKVFTFFALSN